MLELTLNHLKKYIIRAKVNLQIITDLTKFITPLTHDDENTWRLQNIAASFVWIYPETRGLLIPQMINLQKISGVSFNKGCYTGQEIIARTENLGKLKRHLYYAKTVTQKKINLGTELTADQQQPIGIIVELAQSSPGNYELLIILQDQLLQPNTSIFADTVALFIEKL